MKASPLDGTSHPSVSFPTRNVRCGALAFLALAALVLPPAPVRGAAPSERPIAVHHVTIVDTSQGAARADMTVLVAGGRIASIGTLGAISIPPEAQEVDGTGTYLIPGFWDMHVHLAQPEFRKWTRTVILPLLVANGVTGVRDMGGDFGFIQSLREEIAAGRLVGPRIVAAGAAFDGPPSKSSPELFSLRTVEDARRAVLAQKRKGVDFLKVLSLVPRDAYFEVASEAKKEGLSFAGHVPEAVRVSEAAEAGQRSMEHLTGFFLECSSREADLRRGLLDGIAQKTPYVLERSENHLPPRGAIESFAPERCARVFEAVARNHAWQVPTLVSQRDFGILAAKRGLDDPSLAYIPEGLKSVGESIDFKKLEPEDVRDVAEYFDRSLFLVGRLRGAGARFLAGTDAPYPPHAGFTLHEELRLLVEGGLTPLESLQAATRNPVEFLGEGASGDLEVGQEADLVLLDANPLDDISNTRRIHSVILHGRYFSRADLDQMLAAVRAVAAPTLHP
jgi:imidazolonepropionase-like amidohydrolase